jgi:hypothetical protein
LVTGIIITFIQKFTNMLLKKFTYTIITAAILSCTSIGCSKSSDDDDNSSTCNELESDADAAVARYDQVQTKATCDSAREALSAAANCDDSYKNEYESFPACP